MNSVTGTSPRPERLLALGRQRTPEAIGGGMVIATLKAFIDQAPSAVAREEAEKVLGKLTDPNG